MDVFVNPYTDFGFKKLFGEEKNKHLLISFLNDLLDQKELIVDLTFKNTEQLPDAGAHRKAIFDIYCTNDKGEHFIVELQKAKQNYFKDRTIYYSTFPIQAQAQKGNWDFKLSPVYCIGILDFVFSETKHKKDIIHTVQYKDHHNEVFFDKIKFIYIEMPHFDKTLEQLENHRDRWLYFIKNLADLSHIPDLFVDDIIYQGFETARIAALDDDDRQNYESSLKEYRDLYSVIKTAEQEGFDKGDIHGHERGALEKANIIALNLLRLKTMSIEQVAKATALSLEQIEALKSSLDTGDDNK
jgi:predicted transposase/invertase (TIGR01784 family)